MVYDLGSCPEPCCEFPQGWTVTRSVNGLSLSSPSCFRSVFPYGHRTKLGQVMGQLVALTDVTAHTDRGLYGELQLLGNLGV